MGNCLGRSAGANSGGQRLGSSTSVSTSAAVGTHHGRTASGGGGVIDGAISSLNPDQAREARAKAAEERAAKLASRGQAHSGGAGSGAGSLSKKLKQAQQTGGTDASSSARDQQVPDRVVVSRFP